MRTGSWIAGLVVTLSVGFSSTASAQGTMAEEPGWACKNCAQNLDTQEHFFNGWFGCSSGERCKDCNVFNSCHGNPQTPFTCDLYHWACGASASAIEAVDKAMTAPIGDVAIIQVASRMPHHVSIVSAGYVLVKGCKGEILAAYKVSQATLARIGNSVGTRVLARTS